MQESWKFELPKSQQNEAGVLDLLDFQQKELGIFLSYYYRKEGAVAEKVFLKGKPEFESSLGGKLLLEFDLVHFNACLAIHERGRENIEVTFQIDPVKHIIELTGPYWPTREMDEI